jgi:nucleoside-diphosphate-sugar epimerase
MAGDHGNVTRAPIVLVTGATGFVGRHLSQHFKSHGWTVRAVLRPESDPRTLAPGVVAVHGDPADIESMHDGVRDADAIVHLAARVHRPGETSPRWREQYRLDNVRATETLVQAASDHGVRRLVFVSTVRVHGATCATVCRADDDLAPPDPYAESKLEGETVVRRLARDVEWVIVRPTFVYGRGGKGNFERLVWLTRLACRVPLPLDGLAGRRSMMYVENLASLLFACVVHPAAARRVLLAADDPPIASNQLIRLLGEALGCRPRLYRGPRPLLRAAARLLGRADDLSRLADSYVVDTDPLVSALGWRPPVDLQEALRRSVDDARG